MNFAGPRYNKPEMQHKVNTVGKTLAEVKRAYLSGLIDGDGAIMACIERHKEKKYGFRVRVSVKVTLSSKREIEWLKDMTRIGYTRKNGRTFEWIVRGKKDTEWILEMLKPYIHGKKKQVEIALKILRSTINKKGDLYKLACLADTLSSFNVRSKNRRKNYASVIKESVSRND